MANNLELALRVRADLKQAYDSIGQLTSGFSRLDGQVSASRRGLVSISQQLSSLRSLAVTGIGISGLGDLIKLTDQYGQMASRIKMATDSAEEYRLVQERLLATAQQTYRPLAEAQEMYIRTADALRSLGYNTAQAMDVSDSLSLLFVTNAASGERAANAINAFSKALQTGKIDVEGWQSILAAVPSIIEQIDAVSDKTAEEIRKLGASGQLSLTDLTEGLRASVEQNRAAAEASRVGRFVRNVLLGMGDIGADRIQARIDAELELDRLEAARRNSGSKQNLFLQKQIELSRELAEAQQRLGNI